MLMIILILSMSCRSVSASKTNSANQTETNISAGLLIPDKMYRFSWDLMHPAFDIALDSIRNLYPKLNLKLYYGNDNCSEFISPPLAVEMIFKKGVNVFFGPVCNYPAAGVARLAAYWKIPLLTPGAFVDAFDVNIPMYASMTRMLGSYSHLGPVFKEIFNYFGWKPRKKSNIDIYFQHNPSMNKGKTEEYFICSSISKKLTSLGYKHESRKIEATKNPPFLFSDLAKHLRSSQYTTRSML